MSYCNNNNTNTLNGTPITQQRSKQCDLLATSRPCLYGNVGVVLRGACWVGRRVGGVNLSTSGSSGPFCAALPNVMEGF